MSTAGWRLHAREYLEAPGVSLLVYHNDYPEGRQAGIELIHHGERVATNGDLRLTTGAEGYREFGTLKERRPILKQNTIIP